MRNSAELELSSVVALTKVRESRTSTFIPERVRAERYVSLVVLLASVAYLCIFRRYTTMEPDEGIILQGAQRILRGEMLYRDFFSFCTPGSYYWMALLFKIFGNSFAVARSALAVLGGVLSLVGYLISRRVCSRRIALIVTALTTLTALPYRFLVLHNWDSTLWALLTIYCGVRLLESPHRVWAVGLGSCASLTFLFEQSKGAGLFLGLGFGLLLIRVLSPDSCALRRMSLTSVTAGFFSPILAFAAYFAAHHALQDMLSDWLWPLEHYMTANRVPYGFQNWSEVDRHIIFATGPLLLRILKVIVISPCFFVPILPLIALGLLVYWVLRLYRHRSGGLKISYYLLLTSGLAGLWLSVLIARADIIHFMYLLPIMGPVLGWIVEGRDIPGRWFKAVHPVLAGYVVVAMVAFSLPLLLRARGAEYEVHTRRGLVSSPAKDTVISYVQAHVPPDDPLLVYPYLPLYNYLTATSSPTTQLFFQPGMNTTQQADEMVAQLSSKRVPRILFETSFAKKIPNSWPGTPLSVIAKDPVADYITNSYRNCQALTSPANWQFLFMVRKDLACP